MTLNEVLTELEALGTEQNRRIYARHGAGDVQFGVSFANLNKLARRIKKDQQLSEALWQTGNADARCLAIMVCDAAAMTVADLQRWVDDIEAARYYTLADLFAGKVGASPHAVERAEAWTADEREYVANTGWEVLAVVAMKDTSLPDAYFEAHLQTIEDNIHTAKNRARHAMNSALIAIGLRSPELRQRAQAAGTRIGKVVVDHGQTGCKTPDACSYIDKSWARRKAG